MREVLSKIAVLLARTYFGVFKPKQLNIETKKPLLFLYPGIGDCIMATPAIKTIANKYGGTVDVLCYPQTLLLLHDNPYVRKVWVGKGFKNLLAIKKEHYDTAICLNQFSEPIFAYLAGIPVRRGIDVNGFALTHKVAWTGKDHTVDVISHIAGLEIKDRRPRIYIKKDARKTGLVIVPDAGTTDIARQKIWPAKYFAQLANMIGHKAVICGVDDKLKEEVAAMLKVPCEIAIRQKLHQFIQIIANADMVICNDSAAMHIAAAYNVPCIAIFGPTNYQMIAHANTTVVEGICTKGYGHCFHMNSGILLKCDRPCLMNVTPTIVYKAYKGIKR